MVPTLSMVFMATSAIVSIGLPIALGIIWHKRTGAKASSLFIGAAAFAAFVMILENICPRLVLYGSGSSAFRNYQCLRRHGGPYCAGNGRKSDFRTDGCIYRDEPVYVPRERY